MLDTQPARTHRPPRTATLHGLGVLCGIAAGAWLGAAEAPTKLVVTGLSPFTISLCMVAGVFVARWTLPTLLRGTAYVWADLAGKPHLIVWAILAGALWAVANTLTVFAIRNVGLTIAFPLWNTNCLIGILWGSLLFKELHGASAANWVKVICGALAIVIGAIMLGFSSLHAAGGWSPHAVAGILAALGASVMWGTMYVPYRKAYLSGMNPLSFVTAFTVGELVTMFTLAVTLDGGIHAVGVQLAAARHFIFWLFLGGFCWVIGDLFQQYATKYIGIGRGIPLSNTNQLWGLAWGALVFGELAGVDHAHQWLVIGGSLIMIAGALAISTAVASGEEDQAADRALVRECVRYKLDDHKTRLSQQGIESSPNAAGARRWWDWLIIAAAVGLFAWLARGTQIPPIAMNLTWALALSLVSLVVLLAVGWRLWRQTRFF
ncbi:MAG TPA: GRP family sugar transporter [Tepidisphaeraceae bacterium]|nr:GRP family sugar transporter [Tepidisphaeraceae bacterium]